MSNNEVDTLWVLDLWLQLFLIFIEFLLWPGPVLSALYICV